MPADIQCERRWRAMRVEGQLDFTLVGILNAITAPLAQAGIAWFAISVFETDYVLVRESALETAINALTAAGFHIRR